MLLTRARYLTGAGRWEGGTLEIRGDRLASPASADAEAITTEVLDVRDRLVLPGAIDAHTHLRCFAQEYKGGVANGSRAALRGGVTTVLDMPNDEPPVTDAERLERKREVFRRECRVHWGLHVHAPFAVGAEPGPHAAAKIYMARASSVPALSEPGDLRQALARHPLVAVHAEDETCFADPGPTAERAHDHHLRRPRRAVQSALAKLKAALRSLAEAKRPRVVLCHASTADDVAWLREMKDGGFDVWGETCPHYLLLSAEDYEREGAALKVNPPLGTADDSAALRGALADGTIDFLSTDHAPHAPAEKALGAAAPSGIAGIEWYLPIVVHLVEQGVLGWERAWEAIGARARECYGLRRSFGLASDAPADLVVLARGAPQGPVVTRAAYQPYAGVDLGWHVEATFVGGALAYREAPPVGEGSGPGRAFAEAVRGEEVTP